MKTIKITVKGGVVTDVESLPEGYDYAIIDKDSLELSLKDQILESIKSHDGAGGIVIEELEKEITYDPEQIGKEIKKLLEDGRIYEPHPHKLRYLS